MQIQKYALKVWRKAKCDPDGKVRYLLTPLTAKAKQQLSADNVKKVNPDKEGEALSINVNYGDYTEQAARYATLDIEGLMDGKKPFKLVKDTVSDFGMKTCVRADCWEKVPEILKDEIYKTMYEITELDKEGIEGLGFTVLSPGCDWNTVKAAKEKE